MKVFMTRWVSKRNACSLIHVNFAMDVKKVAMNVRLYLDQLINPKKIVSCLLWASIPALLFYSLSVVGLKFAGFGLMEILRDPAQQSGQSSFLGFVSNIGIWLWVSAAAIGFYASSPVGEKITVGRQRELLFLMSILSLLLAIDDFFLIHDRYIDERLCYLAYAMFAGTLLVRHFRTIIHIEGFAFLLAGSLLALSILTDLIQDHIPLAYRHVQVFEEGFKFMGAATWLYVSVRIGAFRPTLSGGVKSGRSDSS